MPDTAALSATVSIHSVFDETSMIGLLSALFVLSGAAGLIYESIWTRYIGLFVGHDAYAQIIVLVIFLGGMSIGAMAVSSRSARLARPLHGYLAVEFLVGAIGVVFHSIYVWTTGWAYNSVFPTLANGTAVTIMKWALAGALILPQSILLGATFPSWQPAPYDSFPPDRAGRSQSSTSPIVSARWSAY